MTNTDTQFSSRFSGITAATFTGNLNELADWTPTTSTINTGMLSDIGRATIYGPDTQSNWFSRFMKAPLSRGDSVMTARFTEVNSRAYDPKAPDTDLFNGNNPEMKSNVATKNLSRQIAVELNDRWLKQFAQTEEMIGDAAAAIMSVSNVCYLDDMWVASKEYFSANLRSAKAAQMHTMTAKPTEAGFADEMTELLWDISQKQFGYKSTSYNAAGYNTKSESAAICLKKDCEYPAFKKLLSETFNPEMLRIATDGAIGYVDDFATPSAGKPSGAGELLGIVVDPRAWSITPMPEALTTEAFRNPARKSTAFFTTYEYAFEADPFFNCAYIFAPTS